MLASSTCVEGRQCFAVVEASLFRQLEHALSRQRVLLQHCTPEGLLLILARQTPGILIIDPGALTDAQAAMIAGRLVSQPRGVAIYAPLTPAAIVRTIELSRKVASAVIFQSIAEGEGAITRTILGQRYYDLARSFLTRIGPNLELLPSPLFDAVNHAFSDMAGSPDPVALAHSAGLTRRSLDRWLVRAGIRSPRLLLVTPRVLRALGLLCETRYRVRAVAAVAGFHSARHFDANCRALIGVPAARLRDPAIANVAVDRAAETVLTGGCVYREFNAQPRGARVAVGETARLRGWC